MAGVSHLSSNRSLDKRSDYRRFDSNEGLKYRLMNSMLVKNWTEFFVLDIFLTGIFWIRETVMKLVQNAIKSKKKIACAYWWEHSYVRERVQKKRCRTCNKIYMYIFIVYFQYHKINSIYIGLLWFSKKLIFQKFTRDLSRQITR